MKNAFVLIAFTTCASLQHAEAQQSYTFVSVDFPNTSGVTSLSGIDSAGDVVGFFETTAKSGQVIGVAFARLANGRFVTLEDPNNVFNTGASGISDSGVVVGVYSDNGSNGFVYSKGNYQTFDIPGGQTELTGISTNNLIVGNHVVEFNLYGFERTGTGTIQVLPNLNGYPVHATSINKAGAIVGVSEGNNDASGFLREPGSSYQLVNYPGAVSTYLSGINDAGVVVGFQQQTDSGQPASFVYTDGKFTDFAFPGDFTTQAFGINASGVIVGIYYDANFATHGFIATPVE